MNFEATGEPIKNLPKAPEGPAPTAILTNKAALDAVRGLHRRLLSCYVNGEAHYECAECEQAWPCKTIQVIGDAE